MRNEQIALLVDVDEVSEISWPGQLRNALRANENKVETCCSLEHLISVLRGSNVKKLFVTEKAIQDKNKEHFLSTVRDESPLTSVYVLATNSCRFRELCVLEKVRFDNILQVPVSSAQFHEMVLGVVPESLVPTPIVQTEAKAPATATTPRTTVGEFAGQTLKEIERSAIVATLENTDGNVTRAAKRLGIGRATLYRKLDRFKITHGRARTS